MKKLLATMFVALLMAGCGEEAQGKQISKEVKDAPPIPLLIPCEACKKKVSKKSTKCSNCGHPTPDSIVAYMNIYNLHLWYGKIIAEAIDREKLDLALDRRGGKYYAPNQETPYTGWAKDMRENGQIIGLYQFKDGKIDGLYVLWYTNGQKKSEETYKDVNLVTAVAWKPNGGKCPHTNVVNGNGDVFFYRENGTKAGGRIYKDGEQVLE